jgi:hypothetical protein
MSDFELLTTIPEEFSISVTVIARRDRTAQLGVELAQAAPRALFDPLIYDLFDDTKAELNRRAAANEPFGVPLIPTATPTPGPTSQPLYPTVGAVPVQGVGFITQTPTPDLNAPEISPTPTPEPNELTGTPQEPIYPTPGPVITGNN